MFVYLGTDNHLYIPDREIFSLDLTILTVDTIMAEECSSCNSSNCKSFWDYEFIISDKLAESVKDMTLQKLQITRNLPEDPNPNGQEGA